MPTGCVEAGADALLSSFLQRYSTVLNSARALQFVSQLLHSLNASNIMKAAQSVMLEAALEVATEVNKVVLHQADQLWFEDAVLQLRSVTKSALMLGSRQRQQQACQSKPVLTAPLHLILQQELCKHRAAAAMCEAT